MTNNPLQQYFRQPKVFITLPSHGVYNQKDTFSGPVENMPIFGMTGMDEILLKTPDALLTGESTVKVIQSCCPNIKNAWDVSNLDIDALLVAIRIATAGNVLHVIQPCAKCGAENEYDVDISKFLDHFSTCAFNPTVVIDELTIKLQPLNYKMVTGFNLENFSLQKRLMQALNIESEEEKQQLLADIYKDLGLLQNKIFLSSISQIETPDGIVTDRNFISDWIFNTEKSVINQLKLHIDKNNDTWRIPETPVKCDSCGAEDKLRVDLDQSNFFASA